MTEKSTIHTGDVLAVLKTLPDNHQTLKPITPNQNN